MKTITFYNPKGGVGKSTFSCLYASWLQYRHGIRTTLLDLDNQQENFRREETRIRGPLLEKAGRPIKDMGTPWRIVTSNGARQNAYNDIDTDNALWLFKALNMEAKANTQVAIIDFPASENKAECKGIHVKCTMCGLINLHCIIFDRDVQTINSTFDCLRMLKAQQNQNFTGILTNAQTFIRKDRYEELCGQFTNSGLKILPDMVFTSEKIREVKREHVIRSTYEYPDWEKIGGAGDLGYDNLFIDVTRELDKVADYKGSRHTDLSFVHALRKTPQPARQMHGTAYPEYEI